MDRNLKEWDAVAFALPEHRAAHALKVSVVQSFSPRRARRNTNDAASWLAAAEEMGRFAEVLWDDVARGGDLRLTVPVAPPEVWGAGVTYRRSADFREEGTGIYDRVYAAERPELFFKATPWRCAGPGEPIGRRRDSTFTAAEPEVAIVLGRRGTILGFTLANDVSA